MLPGGPVRVEVLDDGNAVYTDEGVTDDQGVTRVDLVGRVDPNAVQALARGDAWTARFQGDSRHCASADTAPFRLVG